MFTYTRTLTDEEMAILENDLVDVKAWIDDAIAGKLNNCTKRGARAYRDKLTAAGAPTVPASDKDAMAALLAEPGHKSRKGRIEDEERLRNENKAPARPDGGV